MDAIDKNGVSRSAHGLLVDIQWNCEHCMARLQYEAAKGFVTIAPGGVCAENPCKTCRLQKYGYGGEV